MTKEDCNSPTLLDNMGDIRMIMSVDYVTWFIVYFFLLLTVMIMLGTSLVLCLSAFDKGTDKNERKNLLLHLTFFTLGVVAILVLIWMYYSHYE